MGVKGLQSYLENHCPISVRKVSIIELAKTHKEVNKCVPVLAVDGMSILHRLYKMDDLEWLYGGQWMQYVHNFRLFVQRFHDEGIELVFFFDGVVEAVKTREWIDRRIEKLKTIQKIFDHITSQGTYPDERFSQLPASMATLIRFALKYICKCDVVNSITDADQEIASFAATSKACFAILSQDSDFVIFDTKPYLSIAHLKLGTLETMEYNRTVFCRAINLPTNRLPLLACLMGNDFVDVESVRGFHRYLTACKGFTSINLVVQKLADFIRLLSWPETSPMPPMLTKQVAERAGIPYDALVEGLLYYSITKEPIEKHVAGRMFVEEAIVNDLRVRHRCCILNPQIYAALSQLSYKSSECLEDQRSTGLMPSSLIFRGLRQRIYSIVFNNNPNVEVEELSAIQGVPVLMEKVKPEIFLQFVEGKSHILRSLWEGRNRDTAQWKAVYDALGSKVPACHFLSAPPALLAFAMLINYLLLNPVGEPRLELWEINALVAQAVTPLTQKPEAIREIVVPYVDARAVHLATIILRGITLLVSLVQLCGGPLRTPDIMPWNFFDGKLFHYLYLMSKAGATMEELVLEDGEAVRKFMQLRMMAIAGTYIQKERYNNQS